MRSNEVVQELAIGVEDVSKDFRLPHMKKSSVKHIFTNLFNQSKGQEETQHALKNISFDVKKGEFFGIVGRNGSGKSTMLKILAEIYQPSKGKVNIRGKLVPFIELGVGFNPELSGRENVYLNGALLGFTKQQIDEQYDDIVAFAELENFMDQKLKNYSSGMQVRLAFSVATRADADILLVDEVLAVGDADFQRKCYDFFGDLKRLKKTVVFVTHDMNAVREYCDRAILIEKSELLAAGTADEVASTYTKLFFDKDDKSLSGSTKGVRWGDDSVTFSEVNVVPDNLTESIDNIEIHFSIKANRDLESLVVGFALKDSSGNPITGMNNTVKNQSIREIKDRDVYEFTWSVPNIFGDGKYSIDVAATSARGKVYEWWEEAVWFRSKRSEKIPYAVQPDIALHHIRKRG